jgi:predicted hydrocarbon binding protein
MNINRKDFLKKACITGACFCGFGRIAFVNANKTKPTASESETDAGKHLIQGWTANLLMNLGSELEPEKFRNLIKKNAVIHFNELKMNDILGDYIGNPDKFIDFISEKWGWKIEFDKKNGILIADENKSYCVCPMVNQAESIGSYVMCNCSEGFAEKMFSVVFERPVKAKVVSSVLRGDASCKYKITV